MLKVHTFAAIALIAFFLIIWFYRTISVESRSGILIRNKYRYFQGNYLLQPHRSNCTGSPRLVIVVTSYAGHVELRSAHRRAMPTDVLLQQGATRVFLLAALPNTEKYITQEAIRNENEIFGDILQGSFKENYRNLTYKHLMGLQWAAATCQNASYILKIDDDTVFRLDNTFELISSLDSKDRDFIVGYMLNTTVPKRMKQNKWYVSQEEYDRNMYPPYVSGWYYITTPQVARRLVREAVYHPFFWIDDVFITGILTEALSIKLKRVPQGFWMPYYEIVECCMKYMIEKNIKCNFSVGPNGNRNNLIVEFNKALEDCDKRMACTKKHNTPTCVLERERSIFSEGFGEIKILNP